MGLVFGEPDEPAREPSAGGDRPETPKPKDTDTPSDEPDREPSPTPTPPGPSDAPEKPTETKGMVGKLTEVADDMSDDGEEDEWDFDDDDYWDYGEGLPPWTAPKPVDLSGPEEPEPDDTPDDEVPPDDGTGTTSGDDQPDTEPTPEPAPEPTPEPPPRRPTPEPVRTPPRSYDDMPRTAEPDYEENIVEPDEDEEEDDGDSGGKSLPEVLLDTLGKMIGLDLFGDDE